MDSVLLMSVEEISLLLLVSAASAAEDECVSLSSELCVDSVVLIEEVSLVLKIVGEVSLVVLSAVAEDEAVSLDSELG